MGADVHYLWPTPTIAASAAAGVLARIPCHPIDTVKARVQSAPGGAGVMATFRSIVRAEGLSGLYRGIGVASVGSGPAACIYLSSYEYLKKDLSSRRPDLPTFVTEFLCGFGAEAFSCCLWVPVDVTKERLQVQDPSVKGRYRSSYDAVRTVARMEGVTGLYRGYFSTLASFGPFSAFYFVFYEEIKRGMVRMRGGEEEGVTPLRVFCEGMLGGGMASAMSSALTNPLDMAKLRLQVQRAKLLDGVHSTQFAYHYPSFLSALASIAKEEGLLALWKGASARVLFAGPQAAITFGLFECFRACMM